MHFTTFTSTIALLAAAAIAAPVLDENISLNDVAKRQTANPCSQWTQTTKLVGDGSPKKWILWKQVSGKMNCGDTDTCSIDKGDYKSWTIGADLGGGSNYITGGFSVQRSWETGSTKTCEAKEGQYTCVWVSVPHTEYEVQTGSTNACGGFVAGKKYRITSPDDEGTQEHTCSSSDCRPEGTQYWAEV